MSSSPIDLSDAPFLERLLTLICERVNPDGTFTLPVKRMAIDLNVKYQRVANALDQLAKRGIIEKGKSRGRTPATHKLLIDPIDLMHTTNLDRPIDLKADAPIDLTSPSKITSTPPPLLYNKGIANSIGKEPTLRVGDKELSAYIYRGRLRIKQADFVRVCTEQGIDIDDAQRELNLHEVGVWLEQRNYPPEQITEVEERGEEDTTCLVCDAEGIYVSEFGSAKMRLCEEHHEEFRASPRSFFAKYTYALLALPLKERLALIDEEYTSTKERREKLPSEIESNNVLEAFYAW